MRIRTGYSFRNAVGQLKYVAERLTEIESPIFPISDRGNTFAFSQWKKIADKAGKKPVFGVELAVSESIQEKKPVFAHWTFFAKDDIASINQLVYLASQQFRYESALTYEQAMMAEGVIKIASHESRLNSMTPQDDLYIGLAPSLSIGAFRQAKEAGFKFIATSDNKYPTKDDQGLYEIICGHAASTQTYPQHILSQGEWFARVQKYIGVEPIADSLINYYAVAERCVADLKTASLPKIEASQTLRMLCEEGAKRIGIDLSDSFLKANEYANRLDYELEVIHEKQFEDYFYIMHDIMQFARSRMACGPARGSSCGSLVCYLLGITTIDPIPFGLLFERFISADRPDLPDIDVDFSDQYRHIVFDYAKQKYGHNHVAKLGAVSFYRPKSALNESANALNIPPWKIEKLAESIEATFAGDERANHAIEDALKTTEAGKLLMREHPEIRIAERMEGHPRHFTTHAAGIVITADPIENFVAVDERTGSAMCDKKDAETLNILKIDALGLTQLSVFEDALALAGLDRFILESIPMDDDTAFQVLNKKQWSGIFQFNGRALQELTSQIRVATLNDIVVLSALCRPGPLDSGGAYRWIARRNEKEAVSYSHPILENILSETYGVVVYQEQVLKICRELGDMSWPEANGFRRDMAKSQGAEALNKYKEPFVKGALAKGFPPENIDKFWDDMVTFGRYGFNKSHAVAYGVVSYQCLWLKAHYPHEFAAATLTHEGNSDKQILMLREMEKEGIGYIPVDAAVSTDKWQVATRDAGKVLVGPVSSVKGLGPKLVHGILSARARGEAIPDRAAKLLANPVTPIDSIWPVRDAFRKLLPDPVSRNIITPPTAISDIQLTRYRQEFVVFCVLKLITLKNENEKKTVERRGYVLRDDGKLVSLNLILKDDTGEIFGKINRHKYEAIGKAIYERGDPENHLYVIKGYVFPGDETSFKMIHIEVVKWIGAISVKTETTEAA